jgi:CheY-like chemotaxis protein
MRERVEELSGEFAVVSSPGAAPLFGQTAQNEIGTNMIRILLADDHGIVRQGTRSLLEKEPDLQVVGEAEDGRSAVEMTESLQPNVVVMDIAMPHLNGLDAAAQIAAATRKWA